MALALILPLVPWKEEVNATEPSNVLVIAAAEDLVETKYAPLPLTVERQGKADHHSSGEEPREGAVLGKAKLIRGLGGSSR
jgi:hypothetical protein